MKNNRGFTLIELLVVIAIIGILSAVVLASLNTARDKGSDAAVQSDLATIRTQAEIYYGDHSNSYGTQAWSSGAAAGCTGGIFSDPNIASALLGADTVNGAGNVACLATGSTYLAAAALSTTTAYWCVDSTGKSKQEPGALPTSQINSCP